MPVITGVIRGQGQGATVIYSDHARPYFRALGGSRVTQRATRIEPSDRDPDCWMVDFAPIGGNVHYVDEDGRSFLTRESALAYEIRRLRVWLHGDNSVVDFSG